MNMKKVLGVVMAAAVAVALTGCSGFDDEPATQAAATASQADNAGSGDASAKGVIYGIYKAGDQTWFIDEGEAAKKVVEQRGDEFIYVDAKMNPEEYLKAIDPGRHLPLCRLHGCRLNFICIKSLLVVGFRYHHALVGILYAEGSCLLLAL